MIPYTHTERLILLDEIERGEKVVLPVSIEHAEFMIRVASFYIDQEHQKTIKVLKADHNEKRSS